jgi:hypothetical protein
MSRLNKANPLRYLVFTHFLRDLSRSNTFLLVYEVVQSLSQMKLPIQASTSTRINFDWEPRSEILILGTFDTDEEGLLEANFRPRDSGTRQKLHSRAKPELNTGVIMRSG